MPKLDQERVERLTTSILLVIRDNYVKGPTGQERVFEALNALAASVSVVVHGADGPGGESHKFFTMALERQFRDQ